jgi:outer membrane receptor protein involved in Fe transport
MRRALSKLHPTPICIAVLATLAAPMAMAQQAQAPAPAPAAAAAPAAEQQIVISGSRIRRDNYTSTAPLQIIRADDAAVAGFTSTTEVLQGTAVTGGQGQINNAFGGFVTDGGPGANTLGLRGFAPTRSLILLNGRRLAPSGTRGAVGAADLNVLPTAIVDRIEVLKDGASSIYGSDAVAGVVNIITKRNVDGFTGSFRLTSPTDGGGQEMRASIVGGFVSDRGFISGAYDFYDRKNLTLGDREWTKCNTDYRRTSANGVVGEWGSFDYVDPATGKPKCYPISGTGSNGVTINTLGTPNRTGVAAAGGSGTTFNRWRPNPAVTTGLVGYEGVGPNINVRDVFDPRMLNRSLISPAKNHNLFVQGGLDLKELNAEAYFEVLANRRTSSQTGYRQLSLDYNRGSPLIPSNLVFPTNFLSSSITSGGLPVALRAFIGFGNDTSSQAVDAMRLVAGVKGSLGKTGWDYDVAVTHSNSKGEYTFESFLTDRLTQSLNVVASGTGFACVNAAGGCVAAPALTPAVIGGQLPADWVNYVWRPVTGTSKYKEDVLTATANGALFTLPYGKVKAAVGAEFRRMNIDDTPAPDAQTGNLYNLTSSTPTRGSDSVKELFAELEVPLLAKLPFAEQLTANVSGRYSDYRSYGTGNTYKFGTIWSPTKWLTLRGTVGTSYRAPALYEQYLGATSGFLSQQNDPCNQWDSPSNNGTIRQANCRSENLPAAFQATQSITVLNSGGAAAGLRAETSKNKTIGLVFQPELGVGMGDLSVAVDFFDIVVDNGVARAGATSILGRCYDDPQFRAGGNFCRLVSARNPASNALTVSDSYVNLATDKVNGFDITARYTNNVGPGKLRLNLTLTRFEEQANKLFAEDELDDFNGTIGNPKWSGGLEMRYDVKEWRFFYGLDWVGKTDSYAYLGQDPATSTYKLNTPDYFTHSVSVGYKAAKWEATIGVRNLTNEVPPSISAQAGYNRVGNAPLYSGYDYTGRRLFVNFTKSF